ncbi:kakapo [Culex quinquefasciatus]|uniref:Kakapo n=1 Tax=Culex quinquefasciatus TaxID=7176 RepID=B0W7C3_CULQU|nr:kakapo [Culex quinquefasciatus]|eukprot:XP_001844607.1 kakapo [Culex quinquefasciatus]
MYTVKKIMISDIVVGQEDNLTAREALLRWARRSTAKYPGVRVNDFTGSWRDGLAFSALIHRNRPDLIDWRDSRSRRPRERLEQAFHVVEREYGVTRLLDPEVNFSISRDGEVDCKVGKTRGSDV